jgi:hypothetical protein
VRDNRLKTEIGMKCRLSSDLIDKKIGCSFLRLKVGEFLFHGGVVVGEFFDGYVLGFVVGEAELAVGA